MNCGMESIAEFGFRVRNGFPMARPITYHGVNFRSRLERTFALHLEEQGERWAYEPRVYGPRGRHYLPDFQLLSAVRPTFIELKPAIREVGKAQWKMSIIWDTEPDALLVVACAEQCLWYAALRGQPWESWQERWAT